VTIAAFVDPKTRAARHDHWLTVGVIAGHPTSIR
jgi:hypothetical protein